MKMPTFLRCLLLVTPAGNVYRICCGALLIRVLMAVYEAKRVITRIDRKQNNAKSPRMKYTIPDAQPMPSRRYRDSRRHCEGHAVITHDAEYTADVEHQSPPRSYSTRCNTQDTPAAVNLPRHDSAAFTSFALMTSLDIIIGCIW